MNFYRRAIRSCWRHKIRSLILMMIFTFLAFAALMALSVNRAAAEGANDVKQTVGGSIHIGLDESRENFGPGEKTENGVAYQYNGDYITQEIIDAISKVDGVVSCNAESEGGYWGAAVNFKYFPGAFNISYAGSYGQPVPYTVTMNSGLSKNFLNGTYTLEEGRHITEKDSFAALISKELADKNGLSVGDSISMYDLDTDSENTFQIVGIFSGTEGMAKEALMADGIAANRGYIDVNGYQKMWHETVLELGSLDVYVDSAENVGEIMEKIQNLPEVKGKTLTYAADTEKFDMIANPLSSLQTMIYTAVAVIEAVGAALTTLLLMLWTRGRKKEAGILMAMGRSKAEIFMQFFAENMLPAILGAVTALGLAVLLADKAGTYFTGGAADNMAMSVVILPSDMAAVCGIGALIVTAAVIVSTATVLRMKPKAILVQMD